MREFVNRSLTFL